MQVAKTKPNMVYQHISKAMIDSKIFDKEFAHITGEIECYHTFKEEIQMMI